MLLLKVIVKIKSWYIVLVCCLGNWTHDLGIAYFIVELNCKKRVKLISRVSISINFCTSVSELLDMCCSSVLTGGGTNIELALHCLHEVEGNIPVSSLVLLSLYFKEECFKQLCYSFIRQHWIYCWWEKIFESPGTPWIITTIRVWRKLYFF